MVRKILVADDEDDLRFMLELHLGREGFDVVCVADGQAALDALTSGSFDFALCDLVMPGLSGLEVIAGLQASAVTTPVVLMSAHADVETALKAIDLGAADYIAKPFRADEVLFRLRKALEQQALVEKVDRLEDALGE